MRGHGSSLWGFPDNIFIDQYLYIVDLLLSTRRLS